MPLARIDDTSPVTVPEFHDEEGPVGRHSSETSAILRRIFSYMDDLDRRIAETHQRLVRRTEEFESRDAGFYNILRHQFHAPQ